MLENTGAKSFKKSPTPENLLQKLNAIRFALELKDKLKSSYFDDEIKESNGDSKKLWKNNHIMALQIKSKYYQLDSDWNRRLEKGRMSQYIFGKHWQ